MFVDNSYVLNYIALKQFQQILTLVHPLHLCLYQYLFELPNNCIVSFDNDSNSQPAFILKTTLLFILFTKICTGGLSAIVTCFLMIYSK